MRILLTSGWLICASVSAFCQNKACQILTRAEIKDATGITSRPPKSTKQEGTVSCTYGNPAQGQFDVSVQYKAQANFERNRVMLHEKAIAVSGIGDRAFLVSPPGTNVIHVVEVLQGTTVVHLQWLSHKADSEAGAKLQGLARKAMARL